MAPLILSASDIPFTPPASAVWGIVIVYAMLSEPAKRRPPESRRRTAERTTTTMFEVTPLPLILAIAGGQPAIKAASFRRTVGLDAVTIMLPATCAVGELPAAILQLTAPRLNEPAVQDGWVPDIVYPWLQLRAHEEPDAKMAPFAQAVSRAPF